MGGKGVGKDVGKGVGKGVGDEGGKEGVVRKARYCSLSNYDPMILWV